jgi:hypothetical protein
MASSLGADVRGLLPRTALYGDLRESAGDASVCSFRSSQKLQAFTAYRDCVRNGGAYVDIPRRDPVSIFKVAGPRPACIGMHTINACKRKVVLVKTGLLIMCLTLLPPTAKNNAELKELTVGPARNGLQFVKVHVVAKNIQQSAGTVYFKGSVDMNFGSYMLLADKAEYDQQSGEIRAHGNVIVKPAPADPRGARQFGIK